MQYVGDAVMAVFGAPFPQTDHADRALAAAISMHERQAAVNDEVARRGLARFGLGIGLSTGEVAAALLGSDERAGVHGRRRHREPRAAAAGSRPARGHDGVVGADRAGADDAAAARARWPSKGEGQGDAGARVPAVDWSDRCNGGERAGAANDGFVRRVRGVRKTFEAELAPVRALRGVDLDVAAGEFVAIMGPSGCGKSTLLNLIAGLDIADEGEITIAGETVTGKNEDELARMRRRHIGIVFQFFNLLEGMTVLENVVLPAVIAGTKRKPAETRARDLLDLLGLGDKASELPGVLSGGQRQRLAIARALANEPTLLLADEPTGALDSEGGHEVLELFKRLHSDGQTIVMVTHNDEVAAARRPHRADARRQSSPTASRRRRADRIV